MTDTDIDISEEPRTPEPQRMKLDMEDPASPFLYGEFACGVVKKGELFTKFCVEELSGVEEDIMAARGPVIERLNTVIANCTVSIGDITDRSKIRRIVNTMPAVDRMIMLMAIRRATHGDYFHYDGKCPECSWCEKARLNLAILKITKMPNPMLRERMETLYSGRKVWWHIQTAKDEMWMREVRREDRQHLLSMLILARLDALEVDGERIVVNRETSYRDALILVKKMKMKERQQLRGIFDREEGDLDTTIEHPCGSCGHLYKMSIEPGDPDFFFPAVE